MRNQEAIHQRLDAICTGMNEVVDQLNAHKESWTSLATWIQDTSHQIADLERSAEKSEVAMGKAHKSLTERLQELENDQEIVRRANNA